MPRRPKQLYHGSTKTIKGPLRPVLEHKTADHVHDRPAVFGTARRDIAALFMCPDEALVSFGFEDDVAFICIWGTEEDFRKNIDAPGYLYVLPGEDFEKVGKDYEWQCFHAVEPAEVLKYESALDGMRSNGARVFFIDDEAIFDRVVAAKGRKLKILCG